MWYGKVSMDNDYTRLYPQTRRSYITLLHPLRGSMAPAPGMVCNHRTTRDPLYRPTTLPMHAVSSTPFAPAPQMTKLPLEAAGFELQGHHGRSAEAEESCATGRRKKKHRTCAAPEAPQGCRVRESWHAAEACAVRVGAARH